jgi:hypothetical protein
MTTSAALARRVRMLRLALSLAIIGALLLLTGPASAHDDLSHADHASAGNPIAAPLLTANIEHLANFPFTGGHVAREGDRLYVGAYGMGMRIFDISNPAAPVEIGAYLPGGRADAPPDAAVFDGRHIAVLNGTRRTSGSLPDQGRTDRTEFLDVTDPAAPRVLWTFGPDQLDGESHNGDIVDARRWYLPSGGVGVQGLRIYDLQPLLWEVPSAPWTLFRGDPVKLWESSPYRGGRPVGPAYTHTHDVEVYTDYRMKRTRGNNWVRRDIVLLAEGGNYTDNNGNTGSIFVVDITNPRQPVVLNRWLHERGDGHHPIRYHHEIQFVDGLNNVALVTDEDLHNGCGSAGGVVALKMSDDLTNATELSEWFIPFSTPAPVCSVHVFSSKAGLVYFGSYNAGLQVVDYSDPAQPRLVGSAIEPGTTAWGALVHGEYVYVGDMSRGLDVFRFSGSANAPLDGLSLGGLLPLAVGWLAAAALHPAGRRRLDRAVAGAYPCWLTSCVG